MRAAIYDELGPGGRERGHARAAAILGQTDGSPERIAAQLMLAAPRGDPVAVRRLREAARRALATGAAEVAVSYLRRALEEPPPDDELAD